MDPPRIATSSSSGSGFTRPPAGTRRPAPSSKVRPGSTGAALVASRRGGTVDPPASAVRATASVDAALRFAARLANLPSLEARHKIALSILQAYLRHRCEEQGIARRHLSVALRNAETHNLLGVLVEDGEFLERLLPLFADKPGPGNARLTAFAQRVARLLRALPSTPMHSKALAGVTRQEHRVLSYVADRYTNKQIARALGCSESVIKFHLRNLFRKLKVSSRIALCEAVERHGIRT